VNGELVLDMYDANGNAYTAGITLRFQRSNLILAPMGIAGGSLADARVTPDWRGHHIQGAGRSARGL
jgi:hypothetical protein